MAKNHQIVLKSNETITLTERELLFVNYYLADANRNATQAAIKAKYSKKTARSQAQRMLTKVDIQKYIHDKTAPLMEALGITQERVLRERASMAFTKLSDLVDDNWQLKPKNEIDPVHYPALQAVEIDEKILMQGEDGEGTVLSRRVKFKLNDKDKSLSVLEQMLGMAKSEEEGGGKKEGDTYNIFTQINQQYNSK